MRLLSTKSHQLESFEDWATIPPYAILSHTWGRDEVLFDDIVKGSGRQKEGWSKIKGACYEAEILGIHYVWVDTCCIFKESSAELSESINSMFAWYRDARICFAYLSDVSCTESFDGLWVSSGFPDESKRKFEDSRWWTRGWTLQELIAPTEVMFFNRNWNFIGMRSSLLREISKSTGIAEEILQGENLDKLHNYSIAQKFSWAAKRVTTRGEDRAYSLLGIFGVNMSMIYGEGEQAAFFRLQKEIFGVYADHSIFAWHYSSTGSNEMNEVESDREKTCELLAPSISVFIDSADVVSEPYDWNVIGRPKLEKVKANSDKPLAKYSSISHGIRIQMLIQKHGEFDVAYLACRRYASTNTMLGLVLELDPRTGQYRRAPRAPKEYEVDSYLGYKLALQDVYVAAPRIRFAQAHWPANCFSTTNTFRPDDALLGIRDVAAHEAGFTLVDYYPKHDGDQPGNERPKLKKLLHFTQDGCILYRNAQSAESFAVVIGARKSIWSAFECQTFMVALVDDIGPKDSAADILEDTLQHNSHLLTDISKQMLIKKLTSEKQVIVSLNSLKRPDNEDFELVGSAPDKYGLWIVVRGPEHIF